VSLLSAWEKGHTMRQRGEKGQFNEKQERVIVQVLNGTFHFRFIKFVWSS